MVVGFIGMNVFVCSNACVVEVVRGGISFALVVVFCGGVVIGMFVVGLVLFGIVGYYGIFMELFDCDFKEVVYVFVGLGFGGLLIFVFVCLGGGIFIKGVDVGVDIVGKIEVGIFEDDLCNLVVIVDNVGDNVGDCVGMVVDLFEIYVVIVVVVMLFGVFMF